MEPIFESIHQFTAQWEGGYVDHPSDPGGATNFGISLRYLKGAGIDVNGDGRVDVQDIRALTPPVAKGIYYRDFWQGPGIYRLPALVAAVVYDGGVNMGVGRSIRHLQERCNGFLKAKDALTVDGKLGPKTEAAVRKVCALSPSHPLVLATAVLERRSDYYKELARQDRFKPFLKGWQRRVKALWDYLHELRKKGVA